MMCFRFAGKDHGPLYWGKYNLTHEMYPPQNFVPDYCNGQCAMLNRLALEKIESEIQVTQMNDFRIEDIYFTGILRQKAGIPSPQEFAKKVIWTKAHSGRPMTATGR